MIARIWHGWTAPDNADAYQTIVSREVLPEIASRHIKGYRGAHLLRRDGEEEVEFTTIMWFDELDDVRGFMGADYEVAHVPPRARAVLSRFDERSAHYDVLGAPSD